MAGPVFRTPRIGAGTQTGTARSSGPGVTPGLGRSGGGSGVTGGTNVRATAVDVDKCIAALESLGPRVIHASEKAAKLEGDREFKITQHRVPVYSSQLQKSGRVVPIDYDAETLTVGIEYGGPAGVGRNTQDVDYALIVHEDLEAHHFFGRTAKYVENVVREELESGRAAEFMGAIIRAELGMV